METAKMAMELEKERLAVIEKRIEVENKIRNYQEGSDTQDATYEEIEKVKQLLEDNLKVLKSPGGGIFKIEKGEEKPMEEESSEGRLGTESSGASQTKWLACSLNKGMALPSDPILTSVVAALAVIALQRLIDMVKLFLTPETEDEELKKTLLSE